MEDKLKEFQIRKNAIMARLDQVSKKIVQINSVVCDLPGAISILPFSLPFDNASLCVKKDIESAKRTSGLYFRSDFVEERRLIETSSDVRIAIEPYLDQFMEYVFSEIEKKFKIYKQVQAVDIVEGECCPTGGCQQCQEEAEERYQDAYEEWKENGFTDK